MRQIIKNFFYQASYQLILILLPIVTIPIVSRALGPTGIGEWNYVNSIVNYFVLVAGLGLANYGVREIAHVRNDKYNLSKKFFEIEFFNLIFSGSILIAYSIFIVNTTHNYLFILQSLVVVASILDISWFFQGIEQFKKITIVNVLVKIFSFLAIFFFVKHESDLPRYVFIQSASILISSISLWFFIKGKVSYVRVTFSEVIAHFFPALKFFVVKIAMSISNNLTKTLLGSLASMVSVGYFSNSLTMILISSSIIGALNTVMIPRMTYVHANQSGEEMLGIFKKTIDVQIFFSFLISFGIILTNEKLIDWFFGKEFTFIIHIVPLLAPAIVLGTIHSAIAAQYLIPHDKMLAYNINLIAATVISVILSVLLIPIFGIYGAVVSYLAFQFYLCVGTSISMYKYSGFKFEFMKIGIYCLSGFLMYVSVTFITQKFPSTPITTLIQVLVGTAVFLIISALFKVNPIFNFIMQKKNHTVI